MEATCQGTWALSARAPRPHTRPLTPGGLGSTAPAVALQRGLKHPRLGHDKGVGLAPPADALHPYETYRGALRRVIRTASHSTPTISAIHQTVPRTATKAGPPAAIDSDTPTARSVRQRASAQPHERRHTA